MKFLFQNIKKIITAVVLLAALIGLTFNENGMLKYFRLKNEVSTLNKEIKQVDIENKGLQSEIDSLKNKVPAKIEKTAREKYGMIRKGEQTIEIKVK